MPHSVTPSPAAIAEINVAASNVHIGMNRLKLLMLRHEWPAADHVRDTFAQIADCAHRNKRAVLQALEDRNSDA